jgi:exopolyphosphatase/guanosine-5'-triphosphate,3'-diphosphate pyrophosphatase
MCPAPAWAGRAAGYNAPVNPEKRGPRLAVIDIGTNTLLLLVVEAGEHDGRTALRVLHDACEFGRLGKGLDDTGALGQESIVRSLAIVREYRRIIDGLEVDRVCVVGTQALREAQNAGEFVEPAVAILGVPIEVIGGEREAELVFGAVKASFPDLADQVFAVADVGGGSTEIIVAADDGKTIASLISLPIGSVRLHERHLRSDPPAPAQVQALIADIDAALARVALPTGACLVGTAGTATTIASVAMKLRRHDPDRIQGFSMPVQAVERQLAGYLERTVEERRHMPGLPAQRADVIAAGTAIYARLLHRMQASSFRISDRGVRWGLAHELAARWPAQ